MSKVFRASLIAVLSLAMALPAYAAPTAVAGDDQNVPEGSQVTLDGSLSQPEAGVVVAWNWQQTSGTSVTLTPDAANPAIVRFTAPTVSSDEMLQFQLTVTDSGDNVSPPDTVQVLVQDVPPANQPPDAQTSPGTTVPEGSVTSVNAGLSSDPDGTIVAFAWTQISGPTALNTSGENTDTLQFTAPDVGAGGAQMTFRVTVTDDDSAQDSADVTFTVTDTAPSNQLPVADAGQDASVLEGTLVFLNGGNSTDDGLIVSHSWTQTDGPPVTLSNPGIANPNFVAPDVNSNTPLTFQLTVTDNLGATDSDSVIITVQDTVIIPNIPPVAGAGPDQSVDEGSAVQLNGTATDADGTIATIAWFQISGPAVSNLQGDTTLTPSFIAPDVIADDVVVFQLTVTDDDGAPGSDTVAIAVKNTTITPPANLPPEANAGPDRSVREGSQATISGAGSDPEGGPVTFQWLQTGGPAVVLQNSSSAAVSFITPNVQQNVFITLRLRVEDSQGAASFDDVQVQILDVPLAGLIQNPAAIEELVLFPNPFNPNLAGMSLQYTLAGPSDITIAISDAFGNLVREIQLPSGANGTFAGNNIFVWDGRNGEGQVVANGVYQINVSARNSSGAQARARDRAAVVK